ncbi:hypothetical protein TNCV_3886001 [Trichonephila clavipes]|nr:hypothetical protein TNCV_3886001 [Trichonephila clavipes]
MTPTIDRRYCAFYSVPLDANTSILIRHVEPGVVWKDDVMVLLHSVILLGAPFPYCSVKRIQNNDRHADSLYWPSRHRTRSQDTCHSANKPTS